MKNGYRETFGCIIQVCLGREWVWWVFGKRDMHEWLRKTNMEMGMRRFREREIGLWVWNGKCGEMSG